MAVHHHILGGGSLSGSQAASRAMRFKTGGIDRDRLRIGAFGGQADHDPGKNPVHAPTLPAIVEGHGRTVLPGRVAPPQAIAIDEYYSAQNPQIIHAWAAMALGEEWAKARHLRFRQPERAVH